MKVLFLYRGNFCSYENFDFGFIELRLLKIKQWIDENDPRGVIIPWSAALETQLIDMSEEEATTFLQEKGTTR